MALNLLPGLGFALAVLSPENVNVVIHSIGAVLAFIPGALAAILSYRMIKGPFRYLPPVFLGALSLLGTVTEFGDQLEPRATDPWPRRKSERVIVYPLILWLVGFGTYLFTVGKPEGGTPMKTGSVLFRATGAVLGSNSSSVGSSLSASSLRGTHHHRLGAFVLRDNNHGSLARFKASVPASAGNLGDNRPIVCGTNHSGFRNSGHREPSYRLHPLHGRPGHIRRDHLGGLHRDETGQPQHRKDFARERDAGVL